MYVQKFRRTSTNFKDRKNHFYEIMIYELPEPPEKAVLLILQWESIMAFTLGNFAKKIIRLSGTTANATQKAACYMASSFVDSPETKKSIQKFSNKISETIDDISMPVSEFAENVIDGTIVLAGNVTGSTAKKVCEMCDASPETSQKAEQYGKFVGRVAVGALIGNAAAGGLTSALSATGTAGAAATSSGLATLGGTMHGGIAVSNVITETSMLCAAKTAEKDTVKEQPKNENVEQIEFKKDE